MSRPGGGSGLNVLVAQEPFPVGDLDGNADRIVGLAASSPGDTDLLLTPELCVCGYPPEDLVSYDEFVRACSVAAGEVRDRVAGLGRDRLHVSVGLPRFVGGRLCNVVQVVSRGKVVAEHAKNHLPNYGVFDEKRHFEPGTEIGTLEIRGKRVALAVCHDIWVEGFRERLRELSPDLVAVHNASPFYLGVQAEREALTSAMSSGGADVVYVNTVGAQDEHVYDGGSHLARGGDVAQRLPFLAEACESVGGGTMAELPGETEQVRRALETCVRSYVRAAGGSKAFVGVSGGIDSAVVLCVAAAALGRDRVTAVAMPSSISSPISLEDARKLASNLGAGFMEIGIGGALDAYLARLEGLLGREVAPVARENLQSRIRGTYLMALANDSGGLVLTTGNKSEMATGYATLYGDMAGAFDVLKDISKTRVYELAAHLNREGEVIPQRIIDRPPTAELRENQLDSDSLPEYGVLDGILRRVVEDLESPASVARDTSPGDTLLFTELLERSEFKRRQAPIGPTVTRRAFGKSWRMPVCNRFSFARHIGDGRQDGKDG